MGLWPPRALKTTARGPFVLRVLAPLIKVGLSAGDKASIEHYCAAGELLMEAKEQVEHGDWGSWLDRNFHLSRGTAKDYMKLARDSQKVSRHAFSTLSQARGDLRAQHGPEWQGAVNAAASRVNYERIGNRRSSCTTRARLSAQTYCATRRVHQRLGALLASSAGPSGARHAGTGTATDIARGWAQNGVTTEMRAWRH